MNKLLNRLGEKLKLLDSVEEIITTASNQNKNKILIAKKLELENDIKIIDNKIIYNLFASNINNNICKIRF